MPALFDRALSRLRAADPESVPPDSSLPPTGGVEVLLDAVPCGVAVFDARQRLVSCNAGFQRLLSLDGALVDKQPLFAEVVEASRRAGGGDESCGLQLTDGRPEGFARRVERRAAGGLRLEVQALAAPDGGFSLALLDVTALRKAEADTRAAQALAQKAQEEARLAVEARNRFAFNMAHELRTPMNAISGMLQLIEDSGLNVEQRDYLGKAQAAARALTGVMSNILDFASVEAGQLTLQPRSFDIQEMLGDLSAVFGSLASEKDLDIVFDIDPRLPDRLVADDQRLRQILNNLGSNAVKFTHSGEVVLAIDVLDASAAGVKLEVSVTDTGIGIAPDQLPALVKGLGQAEGAASRRYGGNGLGLAICRNLLALMGSELHARSEAGRGSRFSFQVTFAVDAPAGIAPGTESRLRVLVADSHASSRRARVRMAQALGWQVQEADTLAAALDTLRQSRFLQMAFIDWRLDGTPPFNAALRAAEAVAGRPVPIVVMGRAAARDQLTTMPELKRRQIATGIFGPATRSMFIQASREAQGHAEGPRVQQLSGRPLAGLRVLVAEDNENNQIVIRDLLQSQGAKVEIAIDGLDTLTSIVANGQYDVILMDWQMPNMDGLETTREIRQIVGFEHIPIIALTANATVADRDACLAAGMDAHLGKPVDARELVAALLRHTRPGAKVGNLAAQATLPRIDREGAIAKLGGDAGLYKKVLQKFVDDAPKSVAQIADAARQGTRKDAHRIAHTLKGNAALLGATDLSHAARDVESCMAAEAGPADDKALKHLSKTLEATLKAFAAP